MSTIPGIGPGSFDKSALARAQERHADLASYQPVLYTLYTEYASSLDGLILRYFDGATITRGRGIWHGGTEESARIDILSNRAALQRIIDLAGDIRVTNAQHTVIVTWQAVSRFDVTEDAVNVAQSAV